MCRNPLNMPEEVKAVSRSSHRTAIHVSSRRCVTTKKTLVATELCVILRASEVDLTKLQIQSMKRPRARIHRVHAGCEQLHVGAFFRQRRNAGRAQAVQQLRMFGESTKVGLRVTERHIIIKSTVIMIVHRGQTGRIHIPTGLPVLLHIRRLCYIGQIDEVDMKQRRWRGRPGIRSGRQL